jgi:hypothetical protein
MVDKQAVCHEAGHAVVAMNFGLVVTEICLEESIPTARFNTTGATVQQACIVYAGGGAAERIIFGCFNKIACQSDQQKVEDAGGNGLENHLDYATEIIRANAECHKAMCNEMVNNWVSEESVKIWSGSNSDKLNFVLLNGTRIKEIWQLYHP